MSEVKLIRYDEVPFHGSVIPSALVEKNGKQTIVVHPKSTCERLGVDWSGQHRNIKDHPVWSKGMDIMTIPSMGGGQGTTMLELRFWLLWLASIHPNKVASETRGLIMAYQEEAAEVLEAHFLKGRQQEPTLPIPQDYGQALRQLADQWDQNRALTEENRLLHGKVQVMAPKEQFYDQVTAMDADIEIGVFAKTIKAGEIRFFRWLRQEEILFKKGKTNYPYQPYVDDGYFRLVERLRTDDAGKEHPYFVTMVTGKGQTWLHKKWTEAMRAAGKPVQMQLVGVR